MKRRLEGLRVMLTRDAESNRAWARRLRSCGAAVYPLATIEITPKTPSAVIEEVESLLPELDWLVFTSANGVRIFSEVMHHRTSSVALPPIAAVGSQTARAARQQGLYVTFVPSRAEDVALAAELPDITGARCLLVRGSRGSKALPDGLRARGARIYETVLYTTRTIGVDDPAAATALRTGAIDALVFASPSAVHGARRRLGDEGFERACGIPAVAIGPSTMTALKRRHFKHVHIAPEPNISGVIDELAKIDHDLLY